MTKYYVNPNGTLPLNPGGNQGPTLVTELRREYECCCRDHCEYRNLDRLRITTTGEVSYFQGPRRLRWNVDSDATKIETNPITIDGDTVIDRYVWQASGTIESLSRNNTWELWFGGNLTIRVAGPFERTYNYPNFQTDEPLFGCYFVGFLISPTQVLLLSGLEPRLKVEIPRPMPFGNYAFSWTRQYDSPPNQEGPSNLSFIVS